jgi:hypothetical protein
MNENRPTEAEAMCTGVPERLRPRAVELAENILLMENRLADTRRALATEQVVIPYDNGGGQTGIRENPTFKAYHALLASYRKTVEQFISLVGNAAEPRDEDNPLARILAEAEAALDG